MSNNEKQKRIPVLEIFGPTIQGEGAVIGRKTMFIRTAGCDFKCDWCDSKFTWDGSAKDDIEMLTAKEIFKRLKSIGGTSFNHVTISGGNPALLKHIDTLVDLLKQNQIYTALETQGSRWQDWMTKINDLTISPKPPSSLMNQDLDTLQMIIETLKQYDQHHLQNLSLKVVIFNIDDYHFAKMLHKQYPDIPFYLQVGNPYLSESVSHHTEKLLERYETLIQQVMADSDMNHVYVLPQLHTLLWSNKKGV